MRSVRSATLQDLAFVVAWIHTPDECERWAGLQVPFPIDLISLPYAIGFSEQNAYVMTVDERLVAFGQIINKAAERQHLAKFIVSPVHRGLGYGGAFLRELIHCSTAGRLSLNVHRDNGVAIALYAAAGFTPAQRPPDQGASPRTRYMEWRRGSSE